MLTENEVTIFIILCFFHQTCNKLQLELAFYKMLLPFLGPLGPLVLALYVCMYVCMSVCNSHRLRYTETHI